MKSSSIASTDILRVLCDIVDLLHSRLTAGQGYFTLELKVAYHRVLTDASGPVGAEVESLHLDGIQFCRRQAHRQHQ
jgi:hypothetical protein